MTISSSLNAGVAGLSANATRLATISDNIANSGTYGYKRAETDFSSLVLDKSSTNYSAGGVRVTTQRIIDQRGALVASSNATDLAVRGRGMIPVTDYASVEAGADLPFMLASTGSFRMDANGVLTSSTGLVLMGWPANADGTFPSYPRDTADALEPVQVDLNNFIGEPTTEISLGVNLPATSTEAGALDDGLGGTLTVDKIAETVSVEYYDNLGTSEALDVTFTPSVPASGASNTWTMVVTDSAQDDAVVGEYTLVFNDTRTEGGTLESVTTISGGDYDVDTGEISVDVASGPMTINIGRLDEPDGLGQLADTFAPTSISKDGSPVGRQTSVEIDANGIVRAQYDIGISRIIYQIPLVDVPNQNALVAEDNQTYSTSPESGSFFLWDAGDGPTGDIVSYAREESTTDVAGELTQLIQTQRAYSSNAKVIQTVDEMLQETTNIKR